MEIGDENICPPFYHRDKYWPDDRKGGTSVYDVMLSYDKGRDIYEISMIYNLTPLQVQTAVQYIQQHRQKLEPELKQILKEKAEFGRGGSRTALVIERATTIYRVLRIGIFRITFCVFSQTSHHICNI